MGNLDFSANADQLKELAAYMASQINVPTIGIGGGYAPIGTINFFDATVAPQDWLACDGSVYNIADYPQLAEWYATQHGASNFYGGDGTTTFAVPDLQGEFLRGTGTNSHTNQGSGANVGVHQDGTRHLPVGAATSSGRMYIYADELLSDGALNPDNIKSSQYDFSVVGQDNTRVIENYGSYTSRPTNTSFLICVKAVVAGEVYSTDERVVGTWIDGKPVYQKTFIGSFPTGKPGTSWGDPVTLEPYVDTLVCAFGRYDSVFCGIVEMRLTDRDTGTFILMTNSARTLTDITMQYTKTTD